MRKSMWLGILGTLAMVGALALSGGPATAAGSPRAYTCSGGDIPSGTYASIRVTGMCQVPTNGKAVINVLGNLTVARGGVFDAQSSPSKITVGHNVLAWPGSLLGLGCQPDTDHTGHPCAHHPNGHSVNTVKGNVVAFKANTVLLNGITVKKNVVLIGGGGDIPWAIKNNIIKRNLVVAGVTADWVGVLFNTIGRNALLTHITVTDPGDPGRTVAVVVNTVGRNLICHALKPGVSGGFIPGEVNFVGGKALGQCAALV